MTQARRQIVFVNAAHGITHYSLLILPTAVLVMARPGGPFGADYGPILALATGMFVLYGIGSLPQGWLAAWVGRKAMMATFFLGTGMSLVRAEWPNWRRSKDTTRCSLAPRLAATRAAQSSSRRWRWP